jgi:predicted permease
MAGWLLRWSRRLLPRAWREVVVNDLEDEARDSGRSRYWVAAQTTVAGVRLRRFTFGDTLRTDVAYAIRSLTRSKGYTTAAIVTFALGIGANIAVFSVIDRMMFRPLPYHEPERLVQLHTITQTDAFPEAGLMEGTLAELIARMRSLESITTAEAFERTFEDARLGQSARLAEASYNLLPVLGVAPVAGRDFNEADLGAAERPILLTDETWAARFGRSREVFDLSIPTLMGMRGPFRIVGILPPGFLVPSSARADHVDGLVLARRLQADRNAFSSMAPSAVGRMAPGLQLSGVQAELDLVGQQLALEFPDVPPFAFGVTVQPIRQGLFMFYRSYASLIAIGAGLVLLVACLNLATLLLARGKAREHEAAIRAALGASRARVLRLTVIESALLCATSAGLALIVCQAVYGSVLSLVPAALRGVAVAPLDGRIIGLALAVATGCALTAAIYPAVRSSGVDVQHGLRQGSGAQTDRLKGGATLMTLEAALGVVLVAGAATTVINFAGMAYGFPGWESRNLYDAYVNHGYGRPDERMRYPPQRVETVLDTIRGIPGVQSAGATQLLRLGRQRSASDSFWRERGAEGFRDGVSDGYFEAIGTPVVAGREFTRTEIAERLPLAVVNRAGGASLWPGRPASDVIGQQVAHENVTYRVIGVVGDVKNAPGEASAAGLYLPLTSDGVRVTQSALNVAVRFADGVTPDLSVFQTRLDAALGENTVTLQSVAERAAPYLQRPRFQAVLFASAAVIALVLAAVGLYALAAFDVARRRREMGIRLTLGATARDLRRAVVGTAVRPVIAGAAAGLVVAWWAAQYLQSFLFEVDARDPWTYALVALVLVATAVVAAWLPARRAARTDPASVLRAT